MRRVLIFILSFQILTAGQLLGEILKTVNLVQHFRMHLESGEVGSLAEFLRLHYFDPNHQASDPQQHERLPLQQASPHAGFVFHLQTEVPLLSGISQSEHRTGSSFHTVSLPANNPSSIFQPPRLLI